jgi:hypothetical protein
MMRPCAFLVALALTWPSLAVAEDPHLEGPARAHVEAGKAAYAAADYDVASREFEAAYAASPEPVLLYSWAQARRLGGHCADAIALYQRFLATSPTEAQITAARTGISLCEQPSTAHAPPPEPPPPPSPLPSSPSPPPPRDPPPPAPLARPSWYRDPVGGGLEEAAHRAARRDDFVELLDQATLRRRIGVVGVGASVALVIGGIVRYATHRPGARGVAVAATGSSIVIAGTF